VEPQCSTRRAIDADDDFACPLSDPPAVRVQTQHFDLAMPRADRAMRPRVQGNAADVVEESTQTGVTVEQGFDMVPLYGWDQIFDDIKARALGIFLADVRLKARDLEELVKVVPTAHDGDATFETFSRYESEHVPSFTAEDLLSTEAALAGVNHVCASIGIVLADLDFADLARKVSSLERAFSAACFRAAPLQAGSPDVYDTNGDLMDAVELATVVDALRGVRGEVADLTLMLHGISWDVDYGAEIARHPCEASVPQDLEAVSGDDPSASGALDYGAEIARHSCEASVPQLGGKDCAADFRRMPAAAWDKLHRAFGHCHVLKGRLLARLEERKAEDDVHLEGSSGQDAEDGASVTSGASDTMDEASLEALEAPATPSHVELAAVLILGACLSSVGDAGYVWISAWGVAFAPSLGTFSDYIRSRPGLYGTVDHGSKFSISLLRGSVDLGGACPCDYFKKLSRDRDDAFQCDAHRTSEMLVFSDALDLIARVMPGVRYRRA